MNNIICIETREFPLSQSEVRARHPEMLIPEPFCCPDGYAFVELGDAPAFDADTHKLIAQAPVEQGGAWVQGWSLMELESGEIAQRLGAARAALAEAATERRWAVETGGITVGDAQVATGLEDQNRITSVIANAQLAGVERVDFKAASGWVSLTIAELQAVAGAIALHVQACFAAERVHHEAIAALPNLAAARAYDVNAGWPV
jgi:hypothetical protein